MIEGFELHRTDFDHLFDAMRVAKSRLRNYAEPFARQVLGAATVDSKNGWVHWDVKPAYSLDGESLVGVDFIRIIYDDRGAPTRTVKREHFTPPVDPNGPLTDDQRKALFSGVREAFGDIDSGERYAFTRKVLGKKPGHDVSWAHGKPGTITAGEASRLLDVLDAVKELV